MDARTLFIHALSPVHSGTGQSVGVVDLPVSREKATGWPMIPGSSIKGTLRDRCQGIDDCRSLVEAAFGPDTKNASDHAGAIVFGDAQLLLMPVRSFFGTFAWVTCPLALSRFRRDQEATGLSSGLQAPAAPAKDSALTTGITTLAQDGKVYLEDLDFDTISSGEADQVASVIGAQLFPEDSWRKHLEQRLLIVDDDTFSYICEVAIPVTARIRMDDEKKTVATGGLWYEEYLPVETVLTAPLIALPRNGQAADLLAMMERALEGTVQLGGKATVGKGLVRMVLSRGGGQA